MKTSPWLSAQARRERTTHAVALPVAITVALGAVLSVGGCHNAPTEWTPARLGITTGMPHAGGASGAVPAPPLGGGEREITGHTSPAPAGPAAPGSLAPRTRWSIRSAVPEGRRLLEQLTPPTVAPEDLYILIDASGSRNEAADGLCAAELAQRAAAWYAEAVPGSRAEVYTTSPRTRAWNPRPLLTITVPAFTGPNRRAATAFLPTTLAPLLREGLRYRSASTGSAFVEDVRRLCDRASSFGRGYRVLIATDLQQEGPALRYGSILAAAVSPRPAAQNRLLDRAGQATGGPLAAPAAAITLIYLPPDDRQGAGLSAPQADALLAFYARLFREKWRVPSVKAAEPTGMVPAPVPHP